jgi:hypothetical protein
MYRKHGAINRNQDPASNGEARKGKNMSETEIWWDNYEDKPTTEKDTAAPPERYTEILICGDGGYMEIWSVTSAEKGNGRLQIAYTKEQLGRIWDLRARATEEHKCKLVRMIRWYVPENHYNQILQRLGLYDGEIPETEADRIMRRLKEKLNGENYLVNKWAAISAINDALAKYIPFLRQDQEGIPLECAEKIKELPPAEPRPVKPGVLSPDDIETIRSHLHAIEEGLANQGRYGETLYYEKLIEKFLRATQTAPDPGEEEEGNEDE